MIFNGVKSDRSSQGLTNDPFVNNSWTWSYPYENKYSPQNRKVEIRDLFPQASITTTTTSFSETPDARSEYDVIRNNLVKPSSFFETYEDAFYFSVFERKTLPKAQPTFKDISLLSSPKNINGFLPLLPGRSEKINAANSLRYFAVTTASLGKISIPTSALTDSSLDSSIGFSMLIPSDVNLGNLVSHAYLPPSISSIGTAPLTGSMTYADTIKFLFGFGDLNNISYGERRLVLESVTSSYVEGFESYSRGTKFYNVSNYNSDPYLKVEWNNPQALDVAPRTWQVIDYQNAALYPGESTFENYHYVSGTVSAGGVLTAGLAWLSSSSPSNSNILMSSGTYDLLPFDPALGGFTGSIASINITSSYPWTFSYDRAVAGHTSDGLFVYFSEVPGMNTTALRVNSFKSDNQSLPVWPIEFVRGKATSPNTDTLVKMEKFDLRSNVSKDSFPIEFVNFVGNLSGTTYEYPLPPGKWRLNFAHIKSGSSTAALVANQDVAAIDNFQIFTWRENAFSPVSGSTIGANNYPEFRTCRIDSRYNPITEGYDKIINAPPIYSSFSDVVTGSADLYKGLAFGVSPIIRGWKYGLHSGFPTYSKSIFRRDRFGQLRDMLEQRQYTKFINVSASPTDEDATMKGVKIKEREESDTVNIKGNMLGVDKAPVEVSFVKQKYEVNARNIGRIYSDPVSPMQTTSQNLSTEVTSSLPYFDGMARHRTEGSFSPV